MGGGANRRGCRGLLTFFLCLCLTFSHVSAGEDETYSVGLPALTLLAVALTSTVALNRPSAHELPGYKVPDLPTRVTQLMNGFSMIIGTYGNKGETYEGERLTSMDEVLDVIEPTRRFFSTGTTRGDWQRILSAFEEDNIPAAAQLDTSSNSTQFDKEVTKNQAMTYLILRKRYFQQLVKGVVEDQGAARTLMEAIFKALVNFMCSDTGLFHVLGQVEDALDELDEELDDPQDTQQPRTLRRDLREAVGISRSMVGRYRDFFKSESALVEGIKRVHESEDGAHLQIIEGFQKEMRGILEEVYSIGERVANSKELEGAVQDNPEVGQILKVFFETYLKTFPSDKLIDIINDLILNTSNPFEESEAPSDFEALRIIMRHFGPMFKNLLQHIAHFKGLGQLASIFEDMQDDAQKPLPYQTVLDLVVNDPSGVADLIDMDSISRTPIKAGKLAVVHTARTKDGREIILRIQVPNARDMLDVEKEILDAMAPELSRALKCSERRVRDFIQAVYEEMLNELKPVLIYDNQTAAKDKFTVDYDLNEEGSEKIRFYVPDFIKKPHKNSHVMAMDRVHALSKADYARHYGDVRAEVGFYLTYLAYQNLLLSPLAEKKPDDVDKAGCMHCDLHLGNHLPEAPFEEDGATIYPVAIIDWGLFKWLSHGTLQDIALLVYGAGYNDVGAISDALWRLKSGVRKGHNYGDLKRVVARNIRVLNQRSPYQRRFESPGFWIRKVWMEEEIINLPGSMIFLESGVSALESTFRRLGNHDSEARLLKDRITKESGMRFFWAGHGGWRFLNLASWWRFSYESVWGWGVSCLEQLTGRSGQTDTEED